MLSRTINVTSNWNQQNSISFHVIQPKCKPADHSLSWIKATDYHISWSEQHIDFMTCLHGTSRQYYFLGSFFCSEGLPLVWGCIQECTVISRGTVRFLHFSSATSMFIVLFSLLGPWCSVFAVEVCQFFFSNLEQADQHNLSRLI